MDVTDFALPALATRGSLELEAGGATAREIHHSLLSLDADALPGVLDCDRHSPAGFR